MIMMENYYFKNKLILILPFASVDFTSGKKLTSLKFRSLNLKHCPYYPQTLKSEKPNKTTVSFLNSFLRRVQFIGHYEGFCYSVFKYTNEDEFKQIIKKIKEDIEFLYYLFQKNRHNIPTDFPKYYLIKDIVYYNDKISKLSFKFYKEYLNEYNNEHQVIYGNEIDDKHDKIAIEIKSGNIYSISNDWKNYLQNEIPQDLFWGLFWHNKAQEKSKSTEEKIIYEVIAIENLLNLKYQNSDEFARRIREELGLGNNGKTCILCKFLRDAHNVRSGLVHGGRRFDYNFPLQAVYGSGKYYNLDFYLESSFRLIFEKMVTGSIISEFATLNLLDRIYPNKARLDEIEKQINQTDLANLKIDNFINTGKLLEGFVPYEHVKIDNNQLNKVIVFLNKGFELLSYDLTINNISLLVNNEKGWQEVEDVISNLENKNQFQLTAKNINQYIAVKGSIDFLKFLSHCVMYKNTEIIRKKQILL